jgi:hypothetical protein
MKNPTPKIQLTILRTGRSLGAFLSLVTLACWGATPAAQADCREGCDITLNNTFLGDEALASNTSGSHNVAIGSDALESNTSGLSNTATGSHALFSNQTGLGNTANGAFTLESNLAGSNNTATGNDALNRNKGDSNTADGYLALALNTTGDGNTASGEFALYSNSNGNHNTAVGQWALRGKKGGSTNIALGYLAGSALTSGDNNIAIGNVGVATESNTIRIGTSGTQQRTYVAGISGVTVAGGVGVVIGANGQLGTMTSSARYKEKIEPMGEASDKLLSLHPVKFRYKKNLDPKAIPQFGLVAEDVAKVDPDLVARDEQGKPYTVRYEAVNAMLLNEFLKEHCKVEEQQATITELESRVAQQQRDFKTTAARQQKQIEALTAGLQKVSAQLELSKSAPRTVLNGQ